LKSETFPAALIHRGSFIPLRLHVVAAGVCTVVHPVRGRWTSDEIEFIFGEIKENRVTDHISIVIARDKLLRLIDFESFEAVDDKRTGSIPLLNGFLQRGI